MSINCVALTSVARAGKDTLFKIIKNILGEKNILCVRHAFADNLKIELNDFLKKSFNISAYTIDPKEKQIIRGILISYAQAKRDASNGRYWINNASSQILETIRNKNIACLTDLRFPNELEFIKELGGLVVHITRLDKYNNKIPPFGEYEKENDPILENKSDYKLVWPTSNDIEFLTQVVRAQLKVLLEKITNER